VPPSIWYEIACLLISYSSESEGPEKPTKGLVNGSQSNSSPELGLYLKIDPNAHLFQLDKVHIAICELSG
jgi:hypothetical protein